MIKALAQRVVVVGGGPAGLRAAQPLAEGGLRVTVVEQKAMWYVGVDVRGFFSWARG